ncbi:hypothetical protein WAI453_012125 [Rhynchosporium graminicola]
MLVYPRMVDPTGDGKGDLATLNTEVVSEDLEGKLEECAVLISVIKEKNRG